jgi:hypothetical protein
MTLPQFKADNNPNYIGPTRTTSDQKMTSTLCTALNQSEQWILENEADNITTTSQIELNIILLEGLPVLLHIWCHVQQWTLTWWQPCEQPDAVENLTRVGRFRVVSTSRYSTIDTPKNYTAGEIWWRTAESTRHLWLRQCCTNWTV